ncbi:MAG: hypothetical protein GXO58_05200 [Thermodesulfobacteria bacterium]|nr:hypothetical protein [Thermodesulfobacteriota bacterium]
MSIIGENQWLQGELIMMTINSNIPSSWRLHVYGQGSSLALEAGNQPSRGASQESSQTTSPDNTTGAARNSPQAQQGRNSSSTVSISQEDWKLLQELKARDQEVRAHERAHFAAGGRYVKGGPSYQYQQGPDGKRYAVGGEVSIDVAPEGDPEETLKKMDVVIKAALAPARPSSQDRAVAARAQSQKAQALAELAKEQTDGPEKGSKSRDETTDAQDLPGSWPNYTPGTIFSGYA